MKNSKRFLAMAMACAMSLSLATAALAADSTPGPVTTTDVTKAGGMDEGAAGTTAIFTATIKPTILAVKIPTTVPFNLDNSQPAWDTTGTDKSPSTMQVTQPKLTISNAGATPIYVYVSEVSVNNSAATLTNKIDDVNKNAKNIMFGLTLTEKPKATADSNNLDNLHWMTTSVADTNGSRYYLDNANGLASGATTHGKIEPVTVDSSSGAATPTEQDFYIMCVARLGWSAEDQFSVMPVFTVSVTEPDKAAS